MEDSMPIEEQLVNAARAGDLETLGSLLGESDAKVNHCDSEGYTLVHIAAIGNHAAAVALLQKHGADVNLASSNGGTPMCTAASNGDINVMHALRPHVNVNQADGSGCTPIYCAAWYGHADAVRELRTLQADANSGIARDDGIAPVLVAALRGHAHVIQALAEEPNGANVNQPDLKGHTPAYWAVRKGHAEAVRALVALGADLTLGPLPGGDTLMLLAARLGDADVIRALAGGERRADVNQPDDKGRTPAYWAVRKGHAEAVRALGALGADMNLDDEPGLGGLMHLAAYYGGVDVIDVLAAHGADRNAVKHGKTPTHIANQYRRPAAAKALADWSEAEQASQGSSALVKAARKGDLRVLQLMRHRDPECLEKWKDEDGWTLMHVAAGAGQPEVVEYLARRQGLSVAAVTLAGSTPAHLAARQGHAEVLKVLRGFGADMTAMNDWAQTPLDLAGDPTWYANRRNENWRHPNWYPEWDLNWGRTGNPAWDARLPRSTGLRAQVTRLFRCIGGEPDHAAKNERDAYDAVWDSYDAVRTELGDAGTDIAPLAPEVEQQHIKDKGLAFLAASVDPDEPCSVEFLSMMQDTLQDMPFANVPDWRDVISNNASAQHASPSADRAKPTTPPPTPTVGDARTSGTSMGASA